MRKMQSGGVPSAVFRQDSELQSVPPAEGGLVEQFVGTLNRFERHVLVLHYVEGLSPMEIGTVLDVPGQHVYAALSELKQRTKEAARRRHEDITAQDHSVRGSEERAAVPVH